MNQVMSPKIPSGVLSLNRKQEFVCIGSDAYSSPDVVHNIGLTELEMIVLWESLNGLGEIGCLSISPLPIEMSPSRKWSIVLGSVSYPDPLGYCIPCDDAVRLEMLRAIEKYAAL